MKTLNLPQTQAWQVLSTHPVSSIKTQGPCEIEFSDKGDSRIRSVNQTGEAFAVNYEENVLAST